MKRPTVSSSPPSSTPRVSKRAADLPPSSIRRIFNAAQALQRKGERIIRLDIGDPNFEMPERMAVGIRTALQNRKTHYSAMPGVPELRQAIARHMKRRHGIDCSDQQIVCTQGATQGLNSALQLTCSQGETVLLPAIYWPNYIQQATLASVNVRFYPLQLNLQPDLSRLERTFVPAMRALIINSPGNPTGTLFPPAAMRQIYAFARTHDMWILSDEAYTDFVFEGTHLSPGQIDQEFPPAERRVISIFSFSKSYAATGLRMGWQVLPDIATASLSATMNEPLTGSLTTPIQYGMIRALEKDDPLQRREALRERWELGARLLTEQGLGIRPPEGGLFYFLDISSTGLTGDQFADRLLEQERVSVVPGSGFGLVPTRRGGGRLSFKPNEIASRCIRVCFAVPVEDLKEGLHRLTSFITRHKESA